MITSADVLTIAPELVLIPASEWAAVIAQAYAEMNAVVWGSYLDIGAKWLAAHLATVSLRKGVPGALTSRRVGGVSAGYTLIGKLSPYSTTSYGIEFERLLDARPAARFLVA